MKKLLLMAAGAVLATSASAQTTWLLPGAYCGWEINEAYEFTGEGDNLSCVVEYLEAPFKVSSEGWGEEYAIAEKIEVNKEYTLVQKTDAYNPGDLFFVEGVKAVKNATVKWNPSTKAFEVEAAEADIITGLPDMWVTGSFCGWASPGDDATFKGVEENGVYTFAVNFETEGVTFKIVTLGWGDQYSAAAEILYTPVEVENVGGASVDMTTTLTGEQTLIFDYNEMEVYFLEDSEGGDTNAVSTIVKENDADVIYNINGVKVNRDNMSNGIYIVNGKKVVVRK